MASAASAAKGVASVHSSSSSSLDESRVQEEALQQIASTEYDLSGRAIC